MSIDITQLVLIDLDPVLELDPTIQQTIQSRIEAEMAVRSWTEADITDQRAVLLSLLVTRSLVTRLLLRFSQEIKKTTAGKATVEFDNAIKYLEELRSDLDFRISRTERSVAPDQIPSEVRWPGVGVVGF